jgi:hypothetical protein
LVGPYLRKPAVDLGQELCRRPEGAAASDRGDRSRGEHN